MLERLHQRNEELGGFLATEYGEGDGRFTVLNLPLSTKGGQFPVEGHDYGETVAFEDRLIVTPEKSMVLRTITGEYGIEPSNPEWGPVLLRSQKGGFASDIVSLLVDRGWHNIATSGYHFDTDKVNERKAGSTYTHETQTVYGGREEDVYTLNFGQDHSLSFKPLGDSATTTLSGYSPAVEQESKRIQNQSHHLRGQRINSLEHIVDISLITNPDPAHVAELTRANLHSAKMRFDRYQQEAEERAAAQAQVAAKEKEKPQPDKGQLAQERQNRSADAMLDLLNG